MERKIFIQLGRKAEVGTRKSTVESWKSEDPPRFSQNECTRSLKLRF